MSINVKVFLMSVVFLMPLHTVYSQDNLTARKEVVNIGGLFSLHWGKKVNGSTVCSQFLLDGYEELTAMLFAVNKINENRSLLPGIVLRVISQDTCSSVELASEESLNYTVTKYRSRYGCLRNDSHEDKPVVAIVGERDSDISRAITNLVGLFHIPVISYGSTSTSLNGLQYFLRTIPPDTFIAQAIADILKTFHWNYIILIYSDSEYGRFAADDVRSSLRKQRRKICIAVDEAINADNPSEQTKTWERIANEELRTKVIVVMAGYDDFYSFIKIGKLRYNLTEYVWLSNDLWNGRQNSDISDMVINMLTHAIYVIPYQHSIPEFAAFFHNVSTQQKVSEFIPFASVNEQWFKEYQSVPQNVRSKNATQNSCLTRRSSQVSFVIDAVYSIAWALRDELHRRNGSTTKGKLFSDLLSRIKNVNFENPLTGNQISFTEEGNPRIVKYSVVSLQSTKPGKCFKPIGHWECVIGDDNKMCKGNLSLQDQAFANHSVPGFLGVCGVLCAPGEYKVVNTNFASCCWECQKCTGNKYSDKPGSPSCMECGEDEWPNKNHTTCSIVKPKAARIGEPAGVILGLDALALLLVGILLVFFIRYRKSRMKIFSDPALCYLLLFGIGTTYACSIMVLTDTEKKHCLLLTFLSKIGLTCTTATLLIKTNAAYRLYKKKVFNGYPRSFNQGLKAAVVVCFTIFDVILTWLSINFSDEGRKTSRIVYLHSASGNIALRQCGFFLDAFSRNIFRLLESIFFWGLLLICTHQAYLTRRVTDNSHGLRYVFFGSIATLMNSVFTLLAYSFTTANTKALIFSINHTFFATTALACIFVPKIEILALHPHKDRLFDALSPSISTSPNIDRRNKSVHVNTSTPSPPEARSLRKNTQECPEYHQYRSDTAGTLILSFILFGTLLWAIVRQSKNRKLLHNTIMSARVK